MHKAHLKRVRHARRLVRAQRHQLPVLELDGLADLTFYTLTRALTGRLSPEAATQVIEAVRMGLHER